MPEPLLVLRPNLIDRQRVKTTKHNLLETAHISSLAVFIKILLMSCPIWSISKIKIHPPLFLKPIDSKPRNNKPQGQASMIIFLS